MLVGVLFYRELTWQRMGRALGDTVVDVGMIMFLIAVSGSWTRGLTWDRIPQQLMDGLLGITENPTLLMLVLVGTAPLRASWTSSGPSPSMVTAVSAVKITVLGGGAPAASDLARAIRRT